MYRIVAKYSQALTSLALIAVPAFGAQACGGAQKVENRPVVQAEALPAEAICPVMGKKFAPTAQSDKTVYQGKTLYFCCGGCKEKFEKNPSAYIRPDGSLIAADAAPTAPSAPVAVVPAPAAALPVAATATVADAPAAKAGELVCPVSGEHFVPKANAPKSEYKGKTYVFCCPGCKKKFDAAPEKYLTVAVAKPGEIVCPVSGEHFVPKADAPKSEYKGKTYVFCCHGCKKKFDAAPEKFLAQGAKADCGGDCDDDKGEHKGEHHGEHHGDHKGEHHGDHKGEGKHEDAAQPAGGK